ncbi:MAG: hypothetical protein KIS67_15110 [Verrucomicrobiae bacterium]|nr:hypothetical protein [Verrucomicrobiae bacterium]
MESNKRWIIGGSVLLVVLAAALWFGRPAYRNFREARAVAQARAFLDAKDYANASLSARRALGFNPNSLEACRIMATLAETAGSAVVLEWRRRIAEIQPALTNRLMLAAAALRYQPPPFALARQVLAELPPTATNLVPFHLVSAEMALKLNQLSEAERHLANASALQPTNALHQLNLAVLRLQSTDATIATEARAVLVRLRADPAVGTDALRSLVADLARRGELAAARASSAELLADARSTFEDQLQHLSLLLEDRSPDLAAALSALQQQSSTNVAAIHHLNAWMIGHGLADDALAWLQQLPEATQASPRVGMAMADCHVARKDWPALETALEPQDWGEEDFLRLALRSHGAAQQQQTLAATAHWRAAVKAASDHFGALTALLQLADRWQRSQDTEELLWRIAERFPTQHWTLRELDRLYVGRGDTRGQNRVYAAMLARFPNDLALKNNVAATSLLLNLNPTRAHELARQVYEAEKTNAVFVSTYAFALHVQGKTDEGVKLMQTLPETELQQPSIAAYHALLLAAVGERDRARPYFALAEQGHLLPEERELLAQARRQK